MFNNGTSKNYNVVKGDPTPHGGHESLIIVLSKMLPSCFLLFLLYVYKNFFPIIDLNLHEMTFCIMVPPLWQLLVQHPLYLTFGFSQILLIPVDLPHKNDKACITIIHTYI